MRALVFSLASISMFCVPLAIARSSLDADQFADRIATKIAAARYMESNCAPFEYPGWEGFETIRCSYAVIDKKTGQQKSGLVVMLNPSPSQLSRWLIHACRNVRPDLDQTRCAEYLLSRVISQSGSQFAVAGLVYEDIYPADHVFESYAFRDGVTVRLNDLGHRMTRPLSADELESFLNATPLETITSGAYARIVGTSRNEYKWANPQANVDGLSWLTTVRSAYQRAYRSERNELIEAWLRNNPPK
jgi:hypothetical protein